MASLYIAFIIRFEFTIPSEFFEVLFVWLPWFMITQVVVFYFYKLYDRIWRYTSLFDLFAILRASVTSIGISYIYVLSSMGSVGYPRSVLLLYFILNSILVIGIRLSVRIYFSHFKNELFNQALNKTKKLILIGAGATGEKIAREILDTSRNHSRNQFKLLGFVDDNVEKHGALIHGKKVFGSVENISNLKMQYDELLITCPSATGDQIRNIIKACKKTGKQYKIIPGFDDLIDSDGEILLDKARKVAYKDLLGREEVTLDKESIKNIIQGKRVLITGAGGSIGHELLKQCLTYNPSELICLDISEEKIYGLDQFVDQQGSAIVIKTVLASITNKSELEKVFLENRPQIVFHAAAYKHVPIQELHPWTAVKTNVGGTLNLVDISDRYNIDKFVLVSTDKAVNPVNIMGASKRASEKLIQSFNEKSKTTFIAVRFGNVLGSSGSAIPTFKKQIEKGGPITITHPEMTRYFMSIQEASQLILQCAALGENGEIFLLKMGKPIKILQLAKDLIRLSGLEPDKDIPIVYTGLRPGEKLYEELQLLNEKKIKTVHDKIMILKDKKETIPWPLFYESARALLDAANRLDRELIILLFKQILPSYNPSGFSTNVDKKVQGFMPIKGQA